MAIRYKNTPDDIDVLKVAWRATRKELLRYGKAVARAHEPGNPASDHQMQIWDAAKRRGYSVRTIRKIAAGFRGKSPDTVREALNDFRVRSGLWGFK